MSEQLQGWRDTLDIIDESIMTLLGQRFKICRKVGELKKKTNIPMMQSNRVEEVINRCMLLGKQVGVPETLTKNLYQLIIDQTCQMETEIIDDVTTHPCAVRDKGH